MEETDLATGQKNIRKWGSQFSDRDNSFDDDEDIKFFIRQLPQTEDCRHLY